MKFFSLEHQGWICIHKKIDMSSYFTFSPQFLIVYYGLDIVQHTTVTKVKGDKKEWKRGNLAVTTLLMWQGMWE